MAVNVQYEEAADDFYLELDGRPVARTVHLASGVMVDVDEVGEPVEVESLWARDAIPFEALTVGIERFPSLRVQLLRQALLAA